ncbi:MAG TPA: hypothetical protein VEU33_43720 [Archangium sp.]|nr:hypothetical protein [Archangium sp.]
MVHDEKVVHRDVKEANILVRDENGEPVLLVFHQGCPSPREIPMKLAGAAVLCVFLTGCATTQGTGGSGPSPSPSPGARPAVKKELPR